MSFGYMRFKCPTCSTLLACKQEWEGQPIICDECRARFTVPKAPFCPIAFAIFAGWLLAGLLVIILYAVRLIPGEVHIYALNGHNQPVIVFYQKKQVARLIPDEARLIKLGNKDGLLEVQPAESLGEGVNKPDKGTYMLNLGTSYWVSSEYLRYFSTITTTAEKPKRYERPGLFKVDDHPLDPWAIYEFGESAPGSVNRDSPHPTTQISCGGNSSHRLFRKNDWLSALSLNKAEWGEWGVLIPAAGMIFVWVIGTLTMMPQSVRRHLQKPSPRRSSARHSLG